MSETNLTKIWASQIEVPTASDVEKALKGEDIEEIKRIAKIFKDLLAEVKAAPEKENATAAKNAFDEVSKKLSTEVTNRIKAAKKAVASASPSHSKPVEPKISSKEDSDKEKKQRSGEEIDTTREENFGEWYSQVIIRSEMIDYYDISGCYILRPWAYLIWEEIKSFLDQKFKKSGVKNCYFPLLVSEKSLTKEEENFEDFSPEVAWVTRSGQSPLEEPVAIRPTSETIMYPAYARWIRSHRDLPLRLNQWCNVVRWEFKDAVPFIRSREFLWQEGHSAYANQEDADKEVLEILNYYRSAYEDLMAVPVRCGRKTEKEKFAGALYTTTVEAFVDGSGRAVQAATSHCLGHSFSDKKYFNIHFEDENRETQYVIQNSWGFTTRSIGVMVMVHGDNRGLVLPPRVAPTQVVIIPLQFKGKENEAVNEQALKLADELNAAGIRTEVDLRPGYTPLRKYTYWELRGVPIRIELGPKDIETNQATVCRRDMIYGKSVQKPSFSLSNISESIKNLLNEIHTDMFQRAKAKFDSSIVQVSSWEQVLPTLNQRKLFLSPFCGDKTCENSLKDRTAKESQDAAIALAAAAPSSSSSINATLLTGAAKSLCIPFDQPELAPGSTCISCSKEAKYWTLFGRSY